MVNYSSKKHQKNLKNRRGILTPHFTNLDVLVWKCKFFKLKQGKNHREIQSLIQEEFGNLSLFVQKTYLFKES